MPQNPLPEEILDNIEQDIADRLAGDSWFGQARLLEMGPQAGQYVTIPIITEDLGNIDVLVQRAVAAEGGGPGICIIAQVLEWDVQYKNVFGPYIEDIKGVLLGIENVPMNRGTAAMPSPSGSLKKIKSTMIRAAELLQLWTPPSLTRALVVGECVLARIGDVESGDAGIVQYNLRFKAAGGTGIQPLPVVVDPTFVVTPINSLTSRVTLSCGQVGAAICYSLDNSIPSPRNGTIYSGPFIVNLTVPNVQVGQFMKVKAYLEMFAASNLITQQF